MTPTSTSSEAIGSATTGLGPDFPAEDSSWRAASKRLAMRTAGALGLALHRAFGSRARGRAGILMYHRVMPPPHFAGDPSGMSSPPDNVPPDRFRAQLAGLLRRGFNVRPLRELLACNARGEPLPPRTVAVTFDDGYQSVYRYAWPLLRELQLPATVFLATAHVGAAAPFPFDPWGMAYAADAPPAAYRPLTVDQCREMAATKLADFGAHTDTHRDFRGRPEEFREDLHKSINFVRAVLGIEDVMFAFPYGSRRRGFADAALVAAAKRTGVICGLTTECALIEAASDPFQWGRFNVFPWDSDATLAAKLSGWYLYPRGGRRRPRHAGPVERLSLCAPSDFPPVRIPDQTLNTVSHR